MFSWRTATRVVIALLAAICVAGFAVPANAVTVLNLENDHPVTYNMQGGSTNAGSKWSTDIPQLLNGHNVLALQEAGPLPPFDPNGVFQYQRSFTSNGLTIYYYLRNFGTRSRPMYRHVFFMQTDPRGNRVNLAMVTEEDPNQFWFVPSTFGNSRPAFGVRIGNIVYFTVHGLSSSRGSDMPGMIRTIDRDVRAAGYDYAIMGDFNRDPSTLDNQLPANTFRYRSGRATQRSSGELDYMVSSRNMGALGLIYQGRRIGGISSDHFPVDFGVVPLRAAAGNFSIGSYSNHGNDERVLDVAGNKSANGTHIITYDPNGGRNQQFTFSRTANDRYTIRNVSTGKCLDLNNGTGARRGDYVNEWDCQGQRTQQWLLTTWPGDPGAVEVVNTNTGYCLDVLGNRTGNGPWADIWTCTGASNQKWTLQYLS